MGEIQIQGLLVIKKVGEPLYLITIPYHLHNSSCYFINIFFK